MQSNDTTNVNPTLRSLIKTSNAVSNIFTHFLKKGKEKMVEKYNRGRHHQRNKVRLGFS